MFNNFRVYASVLLLLVFGAVALGVRFVQMFAPVSLVCVLISVLAVFAGAFSANPSNSPQYVDEIIALQMIMSRFFLFKHLYARG